MEVMELTESELRNRILLARMDALATVARAAKTVAERTRNDDVRAAFRLFNLEICTTIDRLDESRIRMAEVDGEDDA